MYISCIFNLIYYIKLSQSLILGAPRLHDFKRSLKSGVAQ